MRSCSRMTVPSEPEISTRRGSGIGGGGAWKMPRRAGEFEDGDGCVFGFDIVKLRGGAA